MTDAVTPIGERQKARLEKRLGKRFAFVSVLGQGGAGTVFEVMNLRLNRKEALKVLADTQPDNFAARFAHEAKVSAAMDHPNIVKIHEFDQDKGSFWYSMQFIDGPSLAQVMAIRKDLSDVAMARLAIPLLDALHYSHHRGVVHRDIKPGNILLNEFGKPFLTDFGIAKTADNLVKTHTGTMLGTPAYVAPEQAMGKTVDHRADIYSLGVTLYEMLAHRLPFTAETSLQTVVMRLREDPEPILRHCPSMHPALAAVIMRALAREKEMRWDSAAEMKEAMIRACEASGIPWDQPLMGLQELTDLRTILAGGDCTIVELGGDGPWRTVEEPPTLSNLWRRLPRFWLGVAILLAAGGFFWWMRRGPIAPPVPPQATPVILTPVVPAPVISAPVISPPVPASPKAPVQPPNPPAVPKALRPAAPHSLVLVQPPQPTKAAPRRAVSPPMLEESVQPEQNSDCSGLTVNLSLRIGEDGRVKSCRVLSKVPSECARAAQEAGMHYRFRPALDAEEKPVEGVVAIAVIIPETP